MANRRLHRDNNQERIEERERICVPGVGPFSNDYLYEWLDGETGAKVNVALLLHKYPVWFKEYKDNRVFDGVSLSHQFKVPRRGGKTLTLRITVTGQMWIKITEASISLK